MSREISDTNGTGRDAVPAERSASEAAAITFALFPAADGLG